MKKVINKNNISNILACWLASDTYGGVREDKSISATSLLRSIQQRVLNRRVINNPEIVEIVDVSTLLKSAMGTAIHKAIQDVWENDKLRISGLSNLGVSFDRIDKIKVNPENPNSEDTNIYFEKRVFKEFHGWNINGQFDLVVNGDVHDFKSTSTYTYLNKIKEKDYIIQGSIYRWLAPELITGDFITIHYIFTDWNKNYLLSNPQYPRTPFVSIQLPLMSLVETEEYIYTRIRENELYEHSEVLPECDNKTLMIDDVWQYFSKQGATRASKNFTSALEANAYMASKGTGYIAKKPAEPKGCNWCNCRGICSQYSKFIENGAIKDEGINR